MFTVTLNHVRDRVRLREGRERLILRVDAAPEALIRGINRAHGIFERAEDKRDEDVLREAGWHMAAAIFGDRQAQDILSFYADDGAAALEMCSAYFQKRLKGLIEKARG